MKYKEIIDELTLEEKELLLTGGGALATAENKRVGIPKLTMSDGPHGVRRLLKHPNPDYEQICNIGGGDVCFPTASALGSSWNKELLYEIGSAIAVDCKEEGIDVLLSPGINMKRTPLCGRNFEYFSEDPILSAELGIAYVKGLQENGVGTSLKHFALNNQEIDRSSISVEVDERTLREYYLKAFELIVKNAKPMSVMCAYNKIGGIWCSENQWLLDYVLRKEWGFDGLIVSDWHAVHSPSKALAAGLDLQMPKNSRIAEELTYGLENGIITIEDIDRSVERILSFVYNLKSGEQILKQNQEKGTYPYDRNKQHNIAKKAALESITLLKNENNTLPISREEYKSIAIFGTYAEEPVIMGGGSSKVTVSEESIDKPLDYIKRYVGNQTQIIYESLFDKIASGMKIKQRIHNIAKEAELAIVFLANEPECEREGIDRDRLTFSEYMNEYTKEIGRVFKKMIVIMQTGSCTASNGWEHRADSILQMWYSGEGGGSAIAEILFGIENPSGKLSETFITRIRKDMDYPGDGTKVWYREGVFNGYRYYDKYQQDVWYPFGHGLSYTNFEYSDLQITPENSDNESQKVKVQFKIKNIGNRAGKEVPQLYVGKLDSIVLRPEKELQAFDKIFLLPGEEKILNFELNDRAFTYYNTYLRNWHVESGIYNIMIGASSQDIRLNGKYKVYWEKDYSGIMKNEALIL